MPKTEVILTHNIVGLGAESDQVKVAAGYARNYLLPQGFAIPLTGANKRRIEALKQRRAVREADELNHMTELSRSLSKLTAVVGVPEGQPIASARSRPISRDRSAPLESSGLRAPRS